MRVGRWAECRAAREEPGSSLEAGREHRPVGSPEQTRESMINITIPRLYTDVGRVCCRHFTRPISVQVMGELSVTNK